VKRAAIELWKANVPVASIRKQLNMPERTLRMILAHEKQKPGGLIPRRKKSPGSGSYQRKFSQETRKKMRKILGKSATLTANDLKKKIPELENVSICIIQRNCLKELAMPYQSIAVKPLLNEHKMTARVC
jgi:hypothetical protein